MSAHHGLAAIHAPVVEPFRPPWWLAGGHRQTWWSSLARPGPRVSLRRTELELDDGDVLELAWSRAGARRAPHLAVLSHGLEGSVASPYMRGMSRAFTRAGWDVLAWNMRGCGQRPNRLPRTYHSGATEDLHAVVRHGTNLGYATVLLVGFSLGGNLTLLYLGRERDRVPPTVAGAVTFSVPVDLGTAARQLERPSNRLYAARFLASLHRRARDLARRHPTALDTSVLRHATTIVRYDDRITAPLHGFDGAQDYYARSSSLPQLPRIDRPTLIVSAADDPFLPSVCYPDDLVASLQHVRLEVPQRGGHVGFRARGDGATGSYWSERRAVAFARAVVRTPGARRYNAAQAGPGPTPHGRSTSPGAGGDRLARTLRKPRHAPESRS